MKDYAKHSNEELCALAKGGDESALAALIQKNRAFIESLVNEISEGENVPFFTEEELINEGAIGIFEAVQRFDPEKGFVFLTLAGRIIRNKLRDLLKKFADSRENLSIEKSQEEDLSGEGILIPSRGMSLCDYVVEKLFLEEVRESVLELPKRQQMILTYKFGIDLSRHPLECPGRNLPDEEVAAYYGSKVSLIRKNLRDAYTEVGMKVYGAEYEERCKK